MQQLGLESEDEYFDRLRGAAPRIVEAELRNLLNLVTVTETCFFRDASQFRLLREHIVPTLMAERSRADDSSRTIRIWSAGCSSGEEAYSIAHHARRHGSLQDVLRTGRSRSSARISTRRRSRRRAGCLRGARGAQRRRAAAATTTSRATARRSRLTEAIKRRVKFEFGNLTQTPMPSTGPQDIVFCKNVAIYFRADVTRKLVGGLHDTLAPDGYLLLGHAESLWQMSDGFTLVEHERRVLLSGRARTSGRSRRRRSPSHQGRWGDKGPKSGRVRLQPDDDGPPEGRHFRPHQPVRPAASLPFAPGTGMPPKSALTALVASCPTFVPGAASARRASTSTAAASMRPCARPRPC